MTCRQVILRTNPRVSTSVCGRSVLGVECVGSAALVILACIFVALSAKGAVHASIVVEARTGRVLEVHNADELCYPASLAKLMTLYLVFTALRHGTLTLNEKLPVSLHAAVQPPTKLWLRPGSRLSVRSAILAITTRSANDAAVVLAEAVGGTECRFAERMTFTARQLGMRRTTFRNASGLPNRGQMTTARDMATLAIALIHNFPQYYHFFDVQSFDFHGRPIYGHDHLLGRCPGVDGLKTGYTRASGYNLVTSAVRDDRRLVGVVMGGPTFEARDHLMVALLNQAFSRELSVTLARSHPRVKAHSEQAASTSATVLGAALDETDTSGTREWVAQIGGRYQSSQEVRWALASARRTVPALNRARALVVKLAERRKYPYQARFVTLNKGLALTSCRSLRRRGFTCIVFPIRLSGVMVAAAGK